MVRKCGFRAANGVVSVVTDDFAVENVTVLFG
jgi:rRNA maturation endonuclease Nob1